MKNKKNIILLLLAICLPCTGYAQGFCFSKGNNHNRMYDYNKYPMPAIGFTPRPYYAIPYGSMQNDGIYANEVTATPPVQGSGQYRSVWGLR
mgnify:CR=1 FL=1